MSALRGLCGHVAVVVDFRCGFSPPEVHVFSEFFCKGYRGFRDEQLVPLTRLTLIYGENNSGKSSLMRLLPWLQASMNGDVPGFLLEKSVLRDAGWPDLVWRGPSGASSAEDDLDLELGLRLEAGAAWRWGSRWRDLKRRFMLERLQFLPKEGDSLRMEKLVRRPGDPGLPLGGILPLSVDSEVPEEETVALRRALSHVRWLYARRTGPSRHGSPRGTIGRIHEDGAQIGAMLLADPALRSRVSRWYELHLNRRIDVESLGADQERLVLVAGGHTSAFPDTGEGVQQAFPVVAALEYLREHGGTLLVEEPESNLHPRLQEALAALVVEVVAANDHAQVIMETHSEVFLWSAYAVAAQHPSSPVSILWVESGADGAGQVIPVGLDPDGRPQTDRMQRAFETMGVLERRVLSARRGARARTPRH